MAETRVNFVYPRKHSRCKAFVIFGFSFPELILWVLGDILFEVALEVAPIRSY
jgi:hypothetical protein